jgi:hypothetical protein
LPQSFRLDATGTSGRRGVYLDFSSVSARIFQHKEDLYKSAPKNSFEIQAGRKVIA